MPLRERQPPRPTFEPSPARLANEPQCAATAWALAKAQAIQSRRHSWRYRIARIASSGNATCIGISSDARFTLPLAENVSGQLRKRAHHAKIGEARPGLQRRRQHVSPVNSCMSPPANTRNLRDGVFAMISIDVTSASAYSAEKGSPLIEMCAMASSGGSPPQEAVDVDRRWTPRRAGHQLRVANEVGGGGSERAKVPLVAAKKN